MGFTHNLGTIAQGVFSDSSLNIGIGAAPSGSYKFETTGTAKISSTLLVSGVTTFGSTLSNGTYTYTLPSATGTLALVGGAGVGTVTSVAALTLGTTGTDLSSTVANGTTTPVITLNVPDASATARGVVTTGTQTFAGAKTLTGNSVFENNDSGNPAVRFKNQNGSGITAQWLTSTNTVGGYIYNNGLISTTPQGDLYGSAIDSFNSYQLNQSLTDPTGTGSAVFSVSPTFTGVPIFGSSISNGTYTYTLPSATGTLALVGGAGVGTVTSVAAITLGTTGSDLSSTVANGTTTPVITLQVPTASAANRGALSSADWSTFNGKQGTITLTTTGTSGAATFSANTLNIPNYGSALSGYLPLTGGTLTGALTISMANYPQLILNSSNSNGATINIQEGGVTNAKIGHLTQITGLQFSGDGTNVHQTIASAGAATFSSTVQATQYTATSTGGSGLRVYGSAGTNQWDIYLNSTNLRFSDNTGTGSIVFDRPLSGTSATFSGTNANIQLGATAAIATSDNLRHIFAGIGAFIGQDANGEANIGNNIYYSTGFKRRVTGFASNVRFDSGNIYLQVAASAAADSAITWTNALTIASTGAATFSSSVTVSYANPILLINGTAGSQDILQFGISGTPVFSTGYRAAVTSYVIASGSDLNTTPLLTIASTGAATFSGNLTCSGLISQLNQTELISSTGASNRAYAFGLNNAAAGDFTISQGSTATGGTYTVRLTINPTGNVGIGTTAPLALLNVNGANQALGGAYNAGYGNLLITSSSTTATIDTGGTLGFGGQGRTSGPAERFVWATISGRKSTSTAGDPKGYLAFETLMDDTNLLQERMRIIASGNVGIGRIAPLGRLTVSTSGAVTNFGAAASSGLSIDAGGSDNITKAVGQLSQIGFGLMNAYQPVAIAASITTTTGYTAAALLFATRSTDTDVAPTERMRITAGGNVLIGTTTDNGAKFQVSGTATFSSSVTTGGNITVSKTTAGLILDGNSVGGNSGAFINLQGWANTNKNWQLGVANIGGGGLLLQTSTVAGGNSFTTSIGGFDQTTGAYTAVSDINRKKDFEESEIGLDAILSLKPTLYRIKEEDETTDKHLGFIAQEVKEFIPQAYSQSGDFIGLDYQSITATLVKAIQEQQAQIEALKLLIK